MGRHGSVKRAINPLRLLSFQLIDKISQILGYTYFFISPSRRKIAEYNLEKILPLLPYEKKKKVVKSSFSKPFKNILELIKIQNFSKEDIERFIKFKGLHNFNNALKKGKGVIVVSGHFGNWELPVIMPVFYPDKTFITVGKKQKPEFFNNFLFKLRKNFGFRVIESKNALLPVFKALKKKGVVGFIIDQRGKKDNSVKVEFFGEKIYCSSAPVYFSLKTGAPIVFSYVEKKNDTYWLCFSDEIVLDRDNGKDFQSLLEINTQKIHNIIKDNILKNPENWYWLHSKFKSKRRVLEECRLK